MTPYAAEKERVMTDPIQAFKDALARAEAAGVLLPNAMALATVGQDGKPSVRTMLLKDADERGFVFYTNFGSRKADELIGRPFASLCFWWGALGEQVRVEGRVARVGEREADEYFATRPRDRQLGAWASRQSETLADRRDLIDAFNRFEEKYKDKDIPRPDYWSGFRLAPESIEFWRDQPGRLHERTLFTRTPDGWDSKQLYP